MLICQMRVIYVSGGGSHLSAAVSCWCNWRFVFGIEKLFFFCVKLNLLFVDFHALLIWRGGWLLGRARGSLSRRFTHGVGYLVSCVHRRRCMLIRRKHGAEGGEGGGWVHLRGGYVPFSVTTFPFWSFTDATWRLDSAEA